MYKLFSEIVHFPTEIIIPAELQSCTNQVKQLNVLSFDNLLIKTFCSIITCNAVNRKQNSQWSISNLSEMQGFSTQNKFKYNTIYMVYVLARFSTWDSLQQRETLQFFNWMIDVLSKLCRWAARVGNASVVKRLHVDWCFNELTPVPDLDKERP